MDKLVEVRCNDGENALVFIHVEVQAQPELDFARRMFTYNYRIFDQYEHEVVSLAVLADERRSWRPSGFGYGRWGCRMRLDFPVVKLLDFEKRRQELAAKTEREHGNAPIARLKCVFYLLHRIYTMTSEAVRKKVRRPPNMPTTESSPGCVGKAPHIS